MEREITKNAETALRQQKKGERKWTQTIKRTKGTNTKGNQASQKCMQHAQNGTDERMNAGVGKSANARVTQLGRPSITTA